MKKLILIVAVVFFGFNTSAQNDGFRVGVNLGVPVGDASDFSSFVANLDVDYDWEVSETINVGAATGLTYYFGKDGSDGFKFLPIAGSVDVSVSEDVSVGGDVGYAISLESGGGGDLLYRFQIRYQASEEVDITGRFNSLSGDGVTFSYASVGAGLRF